MTASEFKTTRIETEIPDRGTFATKRDQVGRNLTTAWTIDTMEVLPSDTRWPVTPGDNPNLARDVLGDSIEVYLSYRSAIERAERELNDSLEAIGKYAKVKGEQR